MTAPLSSSPAASNRCFIAAHRNRANRRTARLTCISARGWSQSLQVLSTDGALEVRGELDVGSRDQLIRAVDEFASSCSHSSCDVVLHLGGVTFIDAAGLGSLVSLSRSLAASGARLRIVRPSRPLRRLSMLCGLDTALGLESGP